MPFKGQHSGDEDDSTWQKFRQVMSRFTANVEAVVAAFLLSHATREIQFPARMRRVLLPTGQEAIRLIRERRQACHFHSISDDCDSDQETEGSEDAFPMTCWDDIGDDWIEQWSVLLTQSRFLDVYVQHVAATTIQRALRRKSTMKSTIRNRAPLMSLYSLQRDIDTKHQAASTLQYAWRRCHPRTSFTIPSNRLKRKRRWDTTNDMCKGALLAQALHRSKDLLLPTILS